MASNPGWRRISLKLQHDGNLRPTRTGTSNPGNLIRHFYGPTLHGLVVSLSNPNRSCSPSTLKLHSFLWPVVEPSSNGIRLFRRIETVPQRSILSEDYESLCRERKSQDFSETALTWIQKPNPTFACFDGKLFSLNKARCIRDPTVFSLRLLHPRWKGHLLAPLWYPMPSLKAGGSSCIK